MPFIDIASGVRLHYEEVGQGEPLILVHGLLGSAADHFAQVMAWLKADYHLYGPTLRGYGQSTPELRQFPLDFYQQDAEDVVAFMDALGIPQAHILGYSDGGEAALVAAGKYPERFRSVAVIGAVGNFDPAIRPRVQAMYPADWITDEEKARNNITNSNAFILPWITAMKHIIDMGGDVSLSLAHHITAPLLIMLGERDTLNPATYARKFLERAGHGELALFACGHAVHDEAWDEFKRVYGDFLRAAR